MSGLFRREDFKAPHNCVCDDCSFAFSWDVHGAYILFIADGNAYTQHVPSPELPKAVWYSRLADHKLTWRRDGDIITLQYLCLRTGATS